MKLNIQTLNKLYKIVESYPITHNAYITKKDGVARRFSIKTPDINMYTQRTFESNKIMYEICVKKPENLKCYLKTFNWTEYTNDGPVFNSFASGLQEHMQHIWEKEHGITR